MLYNIRKMSQLQINVITFALHNCTFLLLLEWCYSFVCYILHKNETMKYDVFISCKSEDYGYADEIYEYLKKNGIHAFLASKELRTLGESEYRKAISEVLKSTYHMIVFASNAEFIDSTWVYYEWDWFINAKLKGFKPGQIVTILRDVDVSDINADLWKYESFTFSNYRERLLFYVNTPDSRKRNEDGRQKEKGEEQINVDNIKEGDTSIPSKRYKNDYFTIENQKELRRLKVQQQFLRDFDGDVYERLLEEKQHVAVLDIGSNNGDLLMDRLGKMANVDVIIGTEINEGTVEVANANWAGGNAQFYHINVEDKGFVEDMRRIMRKHSIAGFDFVNISMVLLHLKDPHMVLWNVRKLMNKNGVIFIRDIDDGLNLAYPDERDYFGRTMRICELNETSGFRRSGRQIPTMLKRAKFSDVKVENMGINTSQMDDEQREAFFEVYFSFILDDAELMAKKYPNQEVFLENYKWLKDISGELEEAFYQDDFFFNLGFMSFSAIKK